MGSKVAGTVPETEMRCSARLFPSPRGRSEARSIRPGDQQLHAHPLPSRLSLPSWRPTWPGSCAKGLARLRFTFLASSASAGNLRQRATDPGNSEGGGSGGGSVTLYRGRQGRAKGRVQAAAGSGTAGGEEEGEGEESASSG